MSITNIEFLSNGEPEPNTPLAEEKALLKEAFEESIIDVLARRIDQAEETEHFNIFDLSSKIPLSEDPAVAMVQIPNCTCYWNNNYMPPGILPPHHIDCPSLGGRHYVHDDCGEEGHRDG